MLLYKLNEIKILLWGLNRLYINWMVDILFDVVNDVILCLSLVK